MRNNKLRSLLTLPFALLASALLLFACAQANTAEKTGPEKTGGFEQFITVKDGRLMEGDKEFRFLSYDVPTLNYVEDEMAFTLTNPYGLPVEFELRDVFETVNEIGGRVIRSYTIPVRNTNFPKESITYVEAPGEFNEEAFKAMDMVLALANEYDVRLIVPLLNNWQWMGGRPDYAAFRGKESDEFWTDPQLIADYKKTIDFVLNRTNSITGVKYKDDKAILAWETGNELQNPASWGIEISRYIKSIDSTHLLMDGFHAIHLDNLDVFVQQYSLDEPAIDIISTHHYESNATAMLANLKKTVEMVGGKKPILLSEFGFISTTGVERVADYVIDEPAIAGAMLWSLRRHHRDGGFFHHSEPGAGEGWRAYHWPGFDDGESYDERALMAMYREKSFAIQGKATPPISLPKAPTLLEFAHMSKISWRGSMGAGGYDIERAISAQGPWTQIAHNVDDIETPGFPLFNDRTAKTGIDYYYRVRALNAAGVSEPSNVVGPVNADYLTLVDRARNFGVLDSIKDIEVQTGDYRSYKEAYSRLVGKAGSGLHYATPGTLVGGRIYAYEKGEAANLVLSLGMDCTDFQPANTSMSDYASVESNYDYLIPRLYTFTVEEAVNCAGIDFNGGSNIVRVELDYIP